MFSSTPRFAMSAKIITPKKSSFSAKNNKDTSSKTKSSTIFEPLRKALNKKLINKCSICQNYVDLSTQGWNKEKLTMYAAQSFVPMLSYSCNNCSLILDSIKDLNQNQKDKTQNLKDKTQNLTDEISRLNEKILQIGTQIKNHEPTVTDSSIYDSNMSFHEDISESSDIQEIQDIELQRRHLRKKRLVIFGAPNDFDDKKFVQELSNELQLGIDVQNIKKTFRIQTRNNPLGKPLPLNVEFFNENDKYKFLNRTTIDKLAKLHMNSKFHGIIVVQDRTYEERKEYNALKSEMIERNNQLKNLDVTYKWKIQKMRLSKVNNFGEGGRIG